MIKKRKWKNKRN